MTDESPGRRFVDELDDDRSRGEGLPEHERDDDTTVGGGVMASGVTATDRGTGETGGTAQGPGAGDDEGETGVATGIVAGTPAAGTQPFAPVFVEDSAEEGVVPDDEGDEESST